MLIYINNKQRKSLASLVQKESKDRRIRTRAMIILLSADGVSRQNIAGLLGMNPSVVTKWKKRFIANDIDGLWDRPRSGRPHKYDDDTEKRILSILDRQPPQGRQRWNRFLVAGELRDVTAHQVWVVMKKNKVNVDGRRSHNRGRRGNFIQAQASTNNFGQKINYQTRERMAMDISADVEQLY